MLRRLPSLGALRAFEATIRCQGLAGAARELSVTTSAISHQIKQLEQELGTKLVRREGRRLALTPAGERLLPGLQEAFQRISSSIADLEREETNAPLRISMLPNFAVNWFLPRLARFRERNPSVQVELVLTTRCVDFAREDVEMAVRLVRTPVADLHSAVLFQDRLTPVCSPAFYARNGPFASPADLLTQPLLISDGRPADAWREWFREVGIAADLPHDALHLENSQLALQAATNGIGIAIIGRRLARAMIDRENLLAPFEASVPEHGTFTIVSPHAWSSRSKVRRMRSWLIAEAAGEALD